MNIKGFYYLLLKETKRFLIVWGQTLLGPVITSVLFLFVFLIAFGKNYTLNSFNSTITFTEFLIPGLVMMHVIQNAFANSSSSILISKVYCTINDILIAPLSNFEQATANILASVIRGFIIAVTIYISYYIFIGNFTHFTLTRFLLSIYFVFISSFIMASAGLIAGLWAINFDRLSSITNLIIMPSTFLSCTFYSVNSLPYGVRYIVHFNPVFYMIDGFRYAFTGTNDFNVAIEVTLLVILAIVLYCISVFLLKIGYKIKS